MNHLERCHPPLDLRSIEDAVLPATFKGLAERAAGRPLRQLGDLGLSLLAGDLPLPVAVLKAPALAHNAAWMRQFAERVGVSLCPHGKTTMAPQLFELQLQEGAWGITAATPSHVRTYRRFGVRRILMANQLVGRANIELIVDEIEADPGFDFYCLVDSLDGLAELEKVLARRAVRRPLQVLLEVGAQGGRSGVRTLEAGLSLGRAIRDAHPRIALRGVEAFEGIFGEKDEAVVETAVRGILATVGTVARTGVAEGWFAPGEVILTAGGSAQFDLAARMLASAQLKADARVVLRSGCYLSHDSGHLERMQARMRRRSPEFWEPNDGLRNAIEVWALVQSVPESRRAICGLGRRDVSFDMELPVPLWWLRPGSYERPQPVPAALRTSGLYDQHAIVDLDDGAGAMPWRVGDLVGFGIAHPCTTFDKWPLLHLVDDDYRVVGGVRTFF